MSNLSKDKRTYDMIVADLRTRNFTTKKELQSALWEELKRERNENDNIGPMYRWGRNIVSRIIQNKCGLSLDDLPDTCAIDNCMECEDLEAFFSQLKETATEILDEEGFGEFIDC